MATKTTKKAKEEVAAEAVTSPEVAAGSPPSNEGDVGPIKCSNCRSRNVQFLTDYVSCLDCGAQTSLVD